MLRRFVVITGLLAISSFAVGQTVTVERLSIGPSGEQSTATAATVAISGDAQFSAFSGSRFPSDTTSQARFFIRDVVGAQTQRVLVDSDRSNVQELRMSDDGRYIAYEMNQGGFPEAKVRDRQTGTDLGVDRGKLFWLSHNARWLVSGPATGDTPSITIDDLVSGASRTLDIDVSGSDSTGTWTDAYFAGAAAIDDSGRWLAYTSVPGRSDTRHTADEGTYLYDLSTGAVLRIAADPGQETARGLWITPDGRYIAFVTTAEGVATIRVFDRVAGFSHRVSNAGGVVPNGDSLSPSISNDGHFVAFMSVATNIVSGDTNGQADIFRFDRPGQSVLRVSVTGSGAQANGASDRPAIIADGSAIAFVSDASNLVSGDTNGQRDAFLDRIQADAQPEPSPEPTPTPPAGGGSQPSDSGGTTPSPPAGSSGSSNSAHQCGFGGGPVVVALMLALRKRRRER